MPTPTPTDLMRQAIAHAQAGRSGEAIAAVRQALATEPENAAANGLLGTLLHASGRAGEALQHLERAHAAAPDEPRMAYQLGAVLASAGQSARGVSLMRRALDLSPQWVQGINGLASVLYGLGDYDGAETTWRRSLTIQPGQPEALCGLGGLLIVTGRPSEAAALFREAARLHPANVDVLGKLVSALNYAEDATPEELVAAHKAWGRAIGAGPTWDPPNGRDPERPLRIGFLSPDLYDHSCAYFLRPILANRERGAFEACCYSTAGRTDWMTAQLRANTDLWRDAASLSGPALVKAIRDDRIDILLELAGHTALGPLAALRDRAAPIQATYLGYPNTTGLPTMNARLVDAITDPPGAEEWHTERLARLPGCFLCYSPPERAPAVRPGADTDPDAIVFGSFNSIRKLSPGVVRAWARTLVQTPGSRLLLKTRGLSAPVARRSLLNQFATFGIGADRVELADMVPTKPDHLAWYNRVDVGLDTFPYNGTTTTCEALWMGVPVVSLAGVVHAGRVGASLLTAAGLPEFIAATEDEYIAQAAGLARDKPRLAALRDGMRERLSASPLLDGPSHARGFYGVLRELWRRWCAGDPR
jgi:predicted O-linked N-acetylglucosamine transferase (SPINDLY family)